MAGFIRRFTSDPGQEVIQQIEGVVIIDREPPGAIQGADSGVVCCVGEFEDGPFDTPTEVLTGTDLANQFGGFGYTYDGVVANNPSARSRLSDGAIVKEYWNGNGFMALTNKRFSRLMVARVDTTVGEVQFTRNACVTGGQAFTYGLVTGQILALAVNSVDGEFSPARITSVAGTYPTGFAGGETISIAVDGASATVVTFLVADQTIDQVINRINFVLGYTAASRGTTANTIVLRSQLEGTSSEIEITAVSGASVTTATGFSVTAAVNGTNNASTATFTGTPAVDTSGAGTYPSTFTGGETMNVTIDQGTDRQIGPVDIVFQAGDQTQAQVVSRINTVLGYTAAVDAGGGVTTITGRVGGTSGNVIVNSIAAAVVTATGFAAGTVNGAGNVGNIAQVTFNEIKTIVEAGITGTRVEQNASGNLRICSTSTTTTGFTEASITVTSGTTATGLGFTIETSGVATDTITGGEASTIPAGTRVTNGVTEWVTARTTQVTAGNPGPYTVRVRPSLDDGTALGATTGQVNTVVAAIAGDAFTVTNLTALTVALTESQIDAAYVVALNSTLNSNAVTKEANIIFSARQSNAIRTNLRTNVLQASSEGLAGRVTTIRPPLKTTRAQARSTSLQPGVGAYRDQRVFYAFPGATTFVPQIAARGLAGGDGFTADGLVDTGFDAWLASLMSNLPPEENPGQLTSFMTAIQAIESGNTDVQDMKIDDYKAFKSAGIAALRIDDGTPIVQSAKTSVNPTTFPNLQNIARRRMADFIQDSIAPRLKAFNKKGNTRERRALVLGEIEAFMNELLSPNNPSAQRIDSFLTDAKSVNTPESIAAGTFRIRLKTRTLSSLDFIVLDTEIGENVITVEEQAA